MNNYLVSPQKSRLRGIGRQCLAACLLLVGAICCAEPIWHCSRSPTIKSDSQRAKSSIQRLDLGSSDLIEIQLIDLYRVYSGEPVQMGGKRLSACYLSADLGLHLQAMEMLGINPSLVRNLSRRSAIVSNQVFEVKDAQELELCISKHHPAVGYLPEVTETDGVAPCF